MTLLHRKNGIGVSRTKVTIFIGLILPVLQTYLTSIGLEIPEEVLNDVLIWVFGLAIWYLRDSQKG